MRYHYEIKKRSDDSVVSSSNRFNFQGYQDKDTAEKKGYIKMERKPYHPSNYYCVVVELEKVISF